MAVVQGIKEKVHLPIYDCFTVKPGEQLRDVSEASNTNVLKFFVNVQGKTKLQTNLQSASLLPHYNTFEARAMRVVLSDLPPKLDRDRIVKIRGTKVKCDAVATSTPPAGKQNVISRELRQGQDVVEIELESVADLLEQIRCSETCPKRATVCVNEEEGHLCPLPDDGDCSDGYCKVTFTEPDVLEALEADQNAPPLEQLEYHNGCGTNKCGTIIGKIIFNTVTSLFVGEKEMIKMPTWFFPGGAGPFSEAAPFTTHGPPSPLDTFRFAEPVFIDKQQNFRVEIEVPDADELRTIKKIYGPLFIWVVLDGFMTRDVQ